MKNNSKEKVKEFIFYNEDDNDSLDTDAQLFIANKWDELIRKNLSACLISILLVFFDKAAEGPYLQQLLLFT